MFDQFKSSPEATSAAPNSAARLDELIKAGQDTGQAASDSTPPPSNRPGGVQWTNPNQGAGAAKSPVQSLFERSKPEPAAATPIDSSPAYDPSKIRADERLWRQSKGIGTPPPDTPAIAAQKALLESGAFQDAAQIPAKVAETAVKDGIVKGVKTADARAVKVGKVADALDNINVPAHQLEKLTEEEWAAIAKAVGVRKPSKISQQQIIEKAKSREAVGRLKDIPIKAQGAAKALYDAMQQN